MKNAREFFKPLAIGAPEPVREIPVRPSRMIHFFDPSNPKMVAKLPDIARQGGHPARQSRGRDPVGQEDRRARGARSKVGKDVDFGQTQFWTRVNSLDSPWLLDDLIRAGRRDRRQARRHHDPEGAGAVGHPLRRSTACAARSASIGVKKPLLIHAMLETASGVSHVEEICAASPRMQGISLGPRRPRRVAPHEDDARRRRPSRVSRAHRSRSAERRGAAHHGAAGSVALHHGPHGRRVRRQRHPAVLRPVRRHRRPRSGARTSSATRS